MINNYYVYGLKIKSEIEIEEFVKLDNIADEDVVTISYSTMSDDIKEKVKEGIRINLSNNNPIITSKNILNISIFFNFFILSLN